MTWYQVLYCVMLCGAVLWFHFDLNGLQYITSHMSSNHNDVISLVAKLQFPSDPTWRSSRTNQLYCGGVCSYEVCTKWTVTVTSFAWSHNDCYFRIQDNNSTSTRSSKHNDQTIMTARQLLSILRLSQVCLIMFMSSDLWLTAAVFWVCFQVIEWLTLLVDPPID